MLSSSLSSSKENVGLRIGTPACTTRGFTEADFGRVVDFMDRAVKITSRMAKIGTNSQKLADFSVYLKKDGAQDAELQKLAQEVAQFSDAFPVPNN